MDDSTPEQEWMEDGRGHALPLPSDTSALVEIWLMPLIAEIGTWVEWTSEEQWTWKGDEEKVARMLQAIVDEGVREAALKIEKFMIKEVL